MWTSDFAVQWMRRSYGYRVVIVVACLVLPLAICITPLAAQERETVGRSGTSKGKGSKGKSKSRNETPKPKFATIAIDSSPGACLVSIDGIAQGVTDAEGLLELKVKRGTRSVKVERSGYRPVTLSVQLDSAKPLSVPVMLVALLGELSVTSIPEDASIFVNGVGTFPGPSVSRELEPGTYEVVVSREGYRVSIRKIEVGPGSKARIDVTLEEIPRRELLEGAERAAADGDFESAISTCRGVLKRWEKNERALLLLGRCLYAVRQFGESADVYSRAVQEGAEVAFPVKHVHESRSGVTFCTGEIAVRGDSVDFRSSTSRSCSLSVLRSRLVNSTFQSANGKPLKLLVASDEPRKSKPVEYSFHPSGARATGKTVDCPNCDESTFMLFRLLTFARP